LLNSKGNILAYHCLLGCKVYSWRCILIQLFWGAVDCWAMGSGYFLQRKAWRWSC